MGEGQTAYLLRMENGLNIHALARGSTSVKNEVRKFSPTMLYCKSSPGGRGYSQKNWVRVYDPLPKTLTLFMTKICYFPYHIIYDLAKISIPYVRPDP